MTTSKRFAPCVSVRFALMLLSWTSFQVWKDPSPHIVHFVEVEPGVRVEVLHWGGSGEPVLSFSLAMVIRPMSSTILRLTR